MVAALCVAVNTGATIPSRDRRKRVLAARRQEVAEKLLWLVVR